MLEVESPLAKKPRIDEETISLNSSSEPNENDDVIILDDEDENIVVSSAPTTPKTPRTPGSKRKHDADREAKQRQREAERKAAEQKKQEEKEKKEQERARQKQARLDEKLKKEEEKRQKQFEREQEAQKRREQKEREEEAAKKAKEDERLRLKAEKEEELRKAKEEKQRLADEKKRIREEEKIKAAEEKRKAEEEAERKRPKLDKWLVKQSKPERQVIQAPSNHWLFSAFEIKDNMKVAPIHFRNNKMTTEEKEKLLKVKLNKSDYLQKLPKRPATKINRMKAKLFQFHTNYRPPYYGTWRKRSKIITGRRPFAKETINDYEYDSDDEWEDEEEGDECKSDEEDIDEEENDEEDDGFFVEHGYLSSDEGDSEECQHLPGETDEERQRRMKERAEEWKNEQKTKYKRNHTTKLVPNEYGPCFSSPGDNISDVIKNNLFTGIILTFID
uniref:Chromatin assembly factor 1 subunit A n=1 Tax=Panagrolaimus superbus TaxID=310955 RepID=A0A914XZ53_9BILA